MGLLADEFGAEGVGEEGAQGRLEGCVVFAGVQDEGGVRAELGEGLTARAAGHGGGVVEVGDSDGADADDRAEFGDGASDGGLFSAGGKAIGAVFDVAASDDFAGFEEQGSAYAEMTVGGVGVLCSRGGDGAKVVALGGCEVGMGQVRHGEGLA
jgi:hypothetical protein